MTTTKIPARFQFGADLAPTAIGERRSRTGTPQVILRRPVSSGTLVQLADRTVRTSTPAHRLRGGEYVATVHASPCSAPRVHVLASSVDLDAEVGDEITGDVTGSDLPERVVVHRVVAREEPVIDDAGSLVRASVYEVTPAAARVEAVAA